MNFAIKLIDIIFPPQCIGCGKIGMLFCKACEISIVLAESACPRCTTPTAFFTFCSNKCRGSWQIDGLFYAARRPKNELLYRMLLAMKYKGLFSLSSRLAEIFAAACRLPTSILVPIPAYWSRNNARGFNQAELLAKCIGEKYGLPVELILKKKKPQQRQATLGRKDRFQNAAGVFSIGENFSPNNLSATTPYIIVDDICTTGATLNSAAAALKSHGAKKIFGAVMLYNERFVAPQPLIR